MSIRWYICPYDVIDDPDIAQYRRCAMCRYLPTQQPNRPHWEEVEILGNHTLVKVNAPDTVHARIALDADFLDVVAATRSELEATLTRLGYTSEELSNGRPVLQGLLGMLEQAGRHRVRNNTEALSERKPWARSLKNLQDASTFEAAIL